MTKPQLTGKVAQQVFELLAQEAYEGKTEALDGLYLMLGEDTKAAIANQRAIIDRLELIERALIKLTDFQIHTALKMLKKE